MKFIESIATSSWVSGFKHVTCARPDCSRWLTQRHLETRRVGVSFDEKWYCSYRCVAVALEKSFGKMAGPSRSGTKHTFRMPLGLTLVSRGDLTNEQLRRANEQQKEDGREIGEVLLELGLVTEKQLTAVRATQWGCPVFEIPEFIPAVGLRVPVNVMQQYLMVPLQYSEKLKKVSIGFVGGIDYGALYALEQITGCKAQPYLITASDYQRYMNSIATPDSIEEQVFDQRHSPAEMRHVLCTFGAQMDAEEVSITRCGDQLWARLKRNSVVADLLFRVT